MLAQCVGSSLFGEHLSLARNETGVSGGLTHQDDADTIWCFKTGRICTMPALI